MCNLKVSTSVFFVLSFLGFSGEAHAQNYVPGEVIVKMKNAPSGPSGFQGFSKTGSQKGLSLKRSFSKMGIYHYSTKVGQSVEETIAELKNDPNVEYAEPNYLLSKKDINGFEQVFSANDIESLAQGNDYLATNANIHATDVWSSLSIPSQKVIVAVIDTGLDTQHSVFQDANALWVNQYEIPNNGIDDDGNGYVDDINGWNFVHNSGYMLDDDGHGTHVAGIILGVGQDIFASDVEESKIEIMPLKFLDQNGIGATSDAINAIYYAIENGAKVLNNSWGGSNYSGALHEAVVYSYDHGVTFVAAAGNTGSNNDFTPMFPASYNVPHVMSVAATTDLDYLASFSNFGVSSVDIGSPGVFILSTIPGGGFGSSSGTSMATPFVAGLAALILVESPEMLGYQVKDIIFNTADPVDFLEQKVSTAGRINIEETINFAKVANVLGDQPSYSFTNQDRELASALAGGGGCGTVAKIYQEMTKNGRGGGPSSGSPGAWFVVIVLGLIALPLLMLQHLRSKLPENRRKHQRFAIESDVTVKVGDKELIGSVSSISMGGVRVDTEEMLEQGSVVTMTISSPTGKGEPIEVTGSIVWSDAQKAYGVQFEQTNKSIREKIRSWTNALKPTA